MKRLALFAAVLTGCVTAREFVVESDEPPVACVGECALEWARAETWIRRHSGYQYPDDVVVTRDRIEALRGESDYYCRDGGLLRRSAGCAGPSLASEPLGVGDGQPGADMNVPLGDASPQPTFVVVRAESGIRLVQRCRRAGVQNCGGAGMLRFRQDSFRRFVRTGRLRK